MWLQSQEKTGKEEHGLWGSLGRGCGPVTLLLLLNRGHAQNRDFVSGSDVDILRGFSGGVVVLCL